MTSVAVAHWGAWREQVLAPLVKVVEAHQQFANHPVALAHAISCRRSSRSECCPLPQWSKSCQSARGLLHSACEHAQLSDLSLQLLAHHPGLLVLPEIGASLKNLLLLQLPSVLRLGRAMQPPQRLFARDLEPRAAAAAQPPWHAAPPHAGHGVGTRAVSGQLPNSQCPRLASPRRCARLRRQVLDVAPLQRCVLALDQALTMLDVQGRAQAWVHRVVALATYGRPPPLTLALGTGLQWLVACRPRPALYLHLCDRDRDHDHDHGHDLCLYRWTDPRLHEHA